MTKNLYALVTCYFCESIREEKIGLNRRKSMRMGERMEGELVTCEKNKCSDGSEEAKLLENHDRNQLAHRRIDVDQKI